MLCMTLGMVVGISLLNLLEDLDVVCYFTESLLEGTLFSDLSTSASLKLLVYF